MSDNRSIRPDSSAFDPEILPVYVCVRDLYRLCECYEVVGGIVKWCFDPASPSTVRLQAVIKSFSFHEVNFFYHVDGDLFKVNRPIFIECSVSHLWGKLFDCVRTDRVSEAVSPRRSSRQRSSQRYKVHPARR